MDQLKKKKELYLYRLSLICSQFLILLEPCIKISIWFVFLILMVKPCRYSFGHSVDPV